MEDNNSSNESCKRGSTSVLQLGPCKRTSVFKLLKLSNLMPVSSLKSDPLVSHGQHFGYATLEDFCAEERKEHKVFERLLDSYPGLLEQLREGLEEEVLHVGELRRRHKVTETLVIDWIAPAGEVVMPPLPKNSKISCGFNHPLTGCLLCPTELNWDDKTKQNLQSGVISISGDQWPLLLYANKAYDPDDPWNGLLRTRLLINAFRHVFTSPSSVDKEPKATRAGNAHLHDMTAVTAASMAYILFSHTDTATNSETFYHSLLDLLEDPDEQGEVTDLLVWWNRQIFPTSSAAKRTLKINSTLSKIRQKRTALKGTTTSNS
ncbi:hypothetical protein F4604DRAFT_1883352 [Suillus subluteus]|nr:hypothetical protein F4604DRAFT_1883352 [Suillus subluteus]